MRFEARGRAFIFRQEGQAVFDHVISEDSAFGTKRTLHSCMVSTNDGGGTFGLKILRCGESMVGGRRGGGRLRPLSVSPRGYVDN